MCLNVQARESAALREALQVEREAASAELEALKAIIQKLEWEIRQKPPPCPIISEDEVEECRRAKEKAAHEVLQLQKVQLHVRQVAAVSFPGCCGSFSFSSLRRRWKPCRERRRGFAKRQRNFQLACLN